MKSWARFASGTLISAVLGLLLAAIHAGGATAYVETNYVACTLAVGEIESALQPADWATVTAGTPVTFSGSSQTQITFTIAASPGALTSAPLESGVATVPSGPESLSFTSPKASESVGSVYWTGSFSSRSVPACKESPEQVVTSKVRTLNVTPAPASPPAPLIETPATSVEKPCVVPNLHGLSLTRARLALKRADCRLGRVTWAPRGPHGRLAVVEQRPRRGAHHTAGTTVSVRMGHATTRRP